MYSKVATDSLPERTASGGPRFAPSDGGDCEASGAPSLAARTLDDPVARSIAAEISDYDRRIAALEAARTRALARAAAHAREVSAGLRHGAQEHELAIRAVSAEIAAATRGSDRSIQAQLGEAEQLAEHFPEALAAWEDGRVGRRHVREITGRGITLPEEVRAEFDQRAVEICAATTPMRARGRLETLAARLHPQTVDDRHRDARRKRCVCVTPGEDGMSELVAILPTLLANAVYDRLTQQARAVRQATSGAEAERTRRADARVDDRAAGARGEGGHRDGGHGPDGRSADGRGADGHGAGGQGAGGRAMDDPSGGDRADDHADSRADGRTMDQIRADVFADTLLTGAPSVDPTAHGDGPGTLGAIRARAQIVVPVMSLLGRSDEPAQLAGHGPVDPDTARRLVGATVHPWERILTHPVSGEILATDTYERRRAIDRHVRARDQHCRFPGCRVPVVRCDVDHTIDFAHGGETSVSNLACLCRRHHTLKHHSGWRVSQRSAGVLEWTSPDGIAYVDRPPALPGSTASSHSAWQRERRPSEPTYAAYAEPAAHGVRFEWPPFQPDQDIPPADGEVPPDDDPGPPRAPETPDHPPA